MHTHGVRDNLRGDTLMNLYTLLSNVSAIVTPNTDYFYDYALHTFDNNGGFLRTRYCWWDKCLENRELKNKEYRVVLLTAEQPLNEESFAPLKHLDGTKAKMQLDYGNSYATFDTDDIIFDIQNGYGYVYLIDMVNKTIQMKHFVEDLSQDSGIREVEIYNNERSFTFNHLVSRKGNR
jgi:hypothetical protein